LSERRERLEKSFGIGYRDVGSSAGSVPRLKFDRLDSESMCVVCSDGTGAPSFPHSSPALSDSPRDDKRENLDVKRVRSGTACCRPVFRLIGAAPESSVRPGSV